MSQVQISSEPQPTKPAFNWEDPLHLDEELTEDERMVRDSAHDYCQENLMPRILEANFRLGGMHIDIHKSRVNFNEQDDNRMAIAGQEVPVKGSERTG